MTARIGTYIASNLLERPKALNLVDDTDAAKGIRRIAAVQTLLKQSMNDKPRLWAVWLALKAYIDVNVEAGTLWKKVGTAVIGIAATGPSDWKGSVRLQTRFPGHPDERRLIQLTRLLGSPKKCPIIRSATCRADERRDTSCADPFCDQIGKDRLKNTTTLPSSLHLMFLFCLPLSLGGCADLNSIYRSERLPNDDGNLVSIDAKQRVVLSSPGTATKNAAKASLRICAEPPPDVFTALASSFGADASLRQSASPEVAAKLAVTLSENAATIERTQTVNILRESMYRNCERYLSGAITEEEFIVQAARDQQLIVQVLAVEQITGVARAQSTALTTIAKAAASGVGDAGLQTLSDAKKDVEDKRSASARATAEAEALSPAGPCGAKPIDASALPTGVSAEQAQTKNAKCTEAATSRQLTREAEDYFELVKETVSKQGMASSETQGKLATAAQEASEASAEIAAYVLEIVRQYRAFDEIGMTCVIKLRTEDEPPKYCEALLQQMADTREAQLQLEETRLNVESVKTNLAVIEAESRSAAEMVWGTLGTNFTPANLKALADKAGVPLADSHKKRLEGANSDLELFVKAFKRLPPNQQSALAKAAGTP